MELFEHVSDDVTILEAHGRVDGTTAKEFGDRLVALIHAGRRRIVVDLENIAYISSAGFRALILAITYRIFRTFRRDGFFIQ
jgi:anti-sigma B factor antagonist